MLTPEKSQRRKIFRGNHLPRSPAPESEGHGLHRYFAVYGQRHAHRGV